MMFKKEILNDIGNFDENFFLYFEDTDFCYRAIKKDYKVVYNPIVKLFITSVRVLRTLIRIQILNFINHFIYFIINIILIIKIIF